MAGIDICNLLTKNLVTARCNTNGGVTGRQWVFQLGQFIGAETYNAVSGALSGFSLVTGEKGIKATGRAKKGSGASAITQADNGTTTVEQTVISEFKYSNQKEATALVDFIKADAKVVFQETASGTIRVYFKQFGNETGSAEDGTGTLIGDDNNVLKVTTKGTEQTLPLFFEAPITGAENQLGASIAYLDALVKADV